MLCFFMGEQVSAMVGDDFSGQQAAADDLDEQPKGPAPIPAVGCRACFTQTTSMAQQCQIQWHTKILRRIAVPILFKPIEHTNETARPGKNPMWPRRFLAASPQIVRRHLGRQCDNLATEPQERMGRTRLVTTPSFPLPMHQAVAGGCGFFGDPLKDSVRSDSLS